MPDILCALADTTLRVCSTYSDEEIEAAIIKVFGKGWVKWFAWYPVKLNKKWCWFRYIERMEIPFGYKLRATKK